MDLIGSWSVMIPAFIVGLMIVTFVFYWLWNTTLPDVFECKKITLWQAFKILLLSIILTGGGTSLVSFSKTSTVTTENTTETSTLKLGL